MRVVASHSGKVVVERRVRETVQKDGGRERESKRERRREKGGGGGGGGEIEEHPGMVGDDALLFVQSDTNTNMWTRLTTPVACKIRRPLSASWSR